MTSIRGIQTTIRLQAARWCLLLLTASLVLTAAPAAAADADPCRGHWVRNLAGAHAVTRQPMTDVASLQRRLPELEASIRTVIGKDASLGPAVADAVIAAIRDGSAVRERLMLRDEPVRWMAYQPEPGRIDVISPACLQLERHYEAFEIDVEVPNPAPLAQAPECAISATRSCVGDDRAFTVDLRGSSPGARVTMAIGGQPETVVEGPGQSWNVRDPGPYDLDATFTVRVEGGPAPARSARVLRFLMPRICGNLAYLGEAPSRTIPATETFASCEESVVVERCAPARAALPPAAPVVAAVDRCEDEWILRPFLFGYFPTGGQQRRDIDLLWTGPASESFEVDDGYGVGLALERRMGPVLGLEAAVLVGRGDSEYTLNDRGITGTASHTVTFQALTLGPNFHLLGCQGADLYLGPFAGYGGFADPNYWVNGHRFVARFDRRFLWGAQIGLDVPFRADSPWGFHGGLRYVDFSQDTDAGSLKVDPLLVELGLAYRF